MYRPVQSAVLAIPMSYDPWSYALHLQGDLESAKLHFSSAAAAKCDGRVNIAGSLALASVHFRQGNNSAALGLYRRALREHPGAPPEVRLGLAACQFRLGQFKHAKAAYERTLDLSPTCGEALLGLAVIAFNSRDTEKWGPPLSRASYRPERGSRWAL